MKTEVRKGAVDKMVNETIHSISLRALWSTRHAIYVRYTDRKAGFHRSLLSSRHEAHYTKQVTKHGKQHHKTQHKTKPSVLRLPQPARPRAARALAVN